MKNFFAKSTQTSLRLKSEILSSMHRSIRGKCCCDLFCKPSGNAKFGK